MNSSSRPSRLRITDKRVASLAIGHGAAATENSVVLENREAALSAPMPKRDNARSGDSLWR